MPSSSLTLPTLPTLCGYRSRHDHLCLPTHRAGAGLQWSLDHLRRAQHCASCVGSAHEGLENRTVDLTLEMGLEKEKAYLPKCQVSEGRRGSALEAAGLPGRMAPTGAHTAGRHPAGSHTQPHSPCHSPHNVLTHRSGLCETPQVGAQLSFNAKVRNTPLKQI